MQTVMQSTNVPEIKSPKDIALTLRDRDKMAAIFADDIFKYIFLNENVWISLEISLKFVLTISGLN